MPGIWFCLLITCVLLASCGAQENTHSVAGTYRLVKDPQLMEGVRAVAVHDSLSASAEQLEMIGKMVAAMDMTIVVKESGEFTADGQIEKPFRAEGTWKLEGEALTLTTTSQDGKVRETPKIEAMVYTGDSIRMPRKENVQPFDLVLRRK